MTDANTMRTSDEWNKEFDNVVMDPDGWRGADADIDWYLTPITLDEFKRRATKSTVKFSRTNEKTRSLFE